MATVSENVERLDPSEIIFQEANPEQREQSWRLNSVSWAGPMSLDQYLAREVHLGKHELCANGRCKYWVLVPAKDPLDIIASCETIEKSVLASDENGLSLLKGYAIASVHTSPKYRRQGMAALLMERLKKWFDTKGEADLSVLYSDIGKEYYTNLGWRVYSSELAYIDILKVSSEKVESNVDILDKDDVRNLCDRDVATLSKEILTKSNDKSVSIIFEPSFEQVSWHFARAEYTGQIFLGQSPQKFGAITKSKDSWIYWFHDFRASVLVIQRFVLSNPEDQQNSADTVELLSAAVSEAETWKLKQVVIWNPPFTNPEHVMTTLKEKYKDRLKVSMSETKTTSIPSLRLKNDKDTSSLEWLHLEYYSWC